MANLKSQIGEPNGGEDGFTLIEVLVSLAILGLTLPILIAVFTGVLMRSELRGQSQGARVLAASLLLQAEARDISIPTSGEEGPLRWAIRRGRYSGAGTGGIAADIVTVTVRWARDHSYTLSSLIPLPADPLHAP